MRFAFASLLVLTTAAGCAATTEDASPIEGEESELRAACTLGAGCPDALKVFAATTLQSVPRVEARDDVTVDFGGNPEWMAEPFASGTTRKLVNDGKGRVVLTGSADGTAPIVVDDFLLVEVLAESGQVLAKGTVNATGALVDGTAPSSLASGATWGGPGKGWSYNQVDITSLLPTDKKPFRIRVSAFDITSFATTTDVYVKTVALAPPPPPPPAQETPWANPCGGTTISYDQLLARFAPAAATAPLGTFVIDGRMRMCHPQTGCAAWQSTRELPLYKVAYRSYNTVTTYRIEDPRAPRILAVPARGHIDLRAATSSVGIKLTVDSAPLVIDTTATRSRGPLLNNYTFEGGLWQVGNLLRGSNTDWVHAVPEKLTPGVMTNSCLFTTGLGRVQSADGPNYTEYQMVLHGTY